jgi:hypothetical protein
VTKNEIKNQISKETGTCSLFVRATAVKYEDEQERVRCSSPVWRSAWINLVFIHRGGVVATPKASCTVQFESVSLTVHSIFVTLSFDQLISIVQCISSKSLVGKK